MNVIWRLGIMKEQEMIVRKNKAQLLKSHLVEICQSLISRFPAMGKESSFSLRMSSTLVYGVAINLRIQAQDLLKATRHLLSMKPASFNQDGINLAVVATSNQLTMAGEPSPADFQLGLMDFDEDPRLELRPMLDRVAPHAITMVEPDMTGLEFSGQPLPVLTEEELLGHQWILDVGEEESKQGEERDSNRKRAREEEESEDPDGKKSRLESEVPAIEEAGTEETVMEPVQPEEEIMKLQAPARPDRELELPTIEVTQGEQEEKRTSPEPLDMREVLDDTNL